MRFAKDVLFDCLLLFAGTVMAGEYRALHFTVQFTALAWLAKGTTGISKRATWPVRKTTWFWI